MQHALSGRPAPDALGRQMVIEMYDCESGKFDDADWVRDVLVEAARRAHATIIDVVFHKFNPVGISGVVVISESHLAIHTWPEHRYAAIDIFTCGDVLDGDAAVSYIARQFGSKRYTVAAHPRGLIAPTEEGGSRVVQPTRRQEADVVAALYATALPGAERAADAEAAHHHIHEGA